MRERQNKHVYSLELTCREEQVDELTAELWEAGTAGIRELNEEGGQIRLIAGFADTSVHRDLLHRFATFNPQWRQEAATDWEEETRKAWPGRPVGNRFFVCPPWNLEEAPQGRLRLVHNPGMASGTGEHPCTQLALEALEATVHPGDFVADVGSGSGMLAIASRMLGAAYAIAVDYDEAVMATAKENYALNGLDAPLAVGSADALKNASVNITVANISATVLLAIFDELQRVTKPGGTLILTGFSDGEVDRLSALVTTSVVLASREWRCIIGRNNSAA